MVRIKYFDGFKYIEIEVTEAFATEYTLMVHNEKLVERKETRRHQSLEKSLENGWDFADPSVDVALQAERDEEKKYLKRALQRLTNRQRTILYYHIEEDKSFREIACLLHLNKDTVREHYIAAIKKLKKFFGNTPSKLDFRGY